VKRLDFRDSQHAKRVPIKRLAFEGALNQRLREPLADTRRLGEVEIPTASLRKCRQPPQFRVVGTPEQALDNAPASWMRRRTTSVLTLNRRARRFVSA
jgi:hypothetical protein